MALEFKLNGDILEVNEILMGWHDTKVSYWYYDIRNWMVSSFGRKGDKPDRHCTDESIAWVRKHYLPRVGIQNQPIATA